MPALVTPLHVVLLIIRQIVKHLMVTVSVGQTVITSMTAVKMSTVLKVNENLCTLLI